MKGKAPVLDSLARLLACELTAMDVYLLQGRMMEDWGYAKLQARLVHESEDERGHADQIISRMLFLEGEPNPTARIPANVGKTPKEMFEADLEYELEVAKLLNETIALCVAEGDNGTRAMLEPILKETEEDHILWLESQLRLMNDLGEAAYLAEQI